jgi:ribosomal protein L11 methyltransferase
MGLLSLVMDLEADEADRLSDALLETGALSVSVEDPMAGTDLETPVYDEPDWRADGEISRWAVMRLRVLVEAGADRGQEVMARAAGLAGMAALPAYDVESVGEEDWVRKTQSQFTPIPISERLWIVPSWHSAPDPRAINIRLDPGVAFGTGSHPTTKLCLRWLERNLRGGETLIDYGCGSGILAIAAARLGAGRIVGVDIDPAAVAASGENAALNEVKAQFQCASEPLHVEADVLVANILSNPLKMLAPMLARHVRAGGCIALSGVLSAQQSEVAAAYGTWFDFERGAEEEGWVCLSGVRKSL